MNSNHATREAVAAVDEPAIRREISEIASRVQAEGRNLSVGDRQFLKDLQRGDRYQWRGIVRLLRLAAACPSDTAAFAIADRFRALIGAQRPAPRLSIALAIQQETAAQGKANLAEIELAMRQNDPGTIARAEQALIAERAKIDDLIESCQRRRLELSGCLA